VDETKPELEESDAEADKPEEKKGSTPVLQSELKARTADEVPWIDLVFDLHLQNF
jgi:hypothetical protein